MRISLLALALLLTSAAAGKAKVDRTPEYDPTLLACNDSSNLVKNPGFEDSSLFPWFKTNKKCTAKRNSCNAYQGRRAVQLTARRNIVGGLAQTFRLNVDSSYKLTFQARATPCRKPHDVGATLQVFACQGIILFNTTLTDTYTTYTAIFYAKDELSDTETIEFQFTGSLVLDDVKLVCQEPVLLNTVGLARNTTEPQTEEILLQAHTEGELVLGQGAATFLNYYRRNNNGEVDRTLRDTFPVFITPYNQGPMVLDDTLVSYSSGEPILTFSCDERPTVMKSFRKKGLWTPGLETMFTVLSDSDTGTTTLRVNPRDGSFDLGAFDNVTYDKYAQDFMVTANCYTFDTRVALTVNFQITIVPRQGEFFSFSNPDAYAPFPLLCSPGIGDLANVARILPRQVPCSQVTKNRRTGSYVLSSNTFTGLHPEESEWVSQRNTNTGASLRAFVTAQLDASALPPNQADSNLKVAIANSGGGKRAFFNSLGVTSGLHRLGIFDHATWHAGLSGGAWMISFYFNQLLRRGNLGLSRTPAELYRDSGVNLRAQLAVFDQWARGNQIMNRRPFQSNRSPLTEETARITCEGALKLNAHAIKGDEVWASSAFMEAYARSISSQVLFDQDSGTREDPVFSDLPLQEPFRSHSSPLPLMQMSQAIQSGYDSPWRILEMTPFDMAINDPNPNGFSLSYPTALFGTDPSEARNGEGTCTINEDLVSNLFGISSYAFTGLANGPGFLGSGAIGLCLRAPIPGRFNPPIADDPCGTLPVRNPFRNSPSVPDSAADLRNPTLLLSDGGFTLNLPIFPFLTPTRKADVIFTVDSSGDAEFPVPADANIGTPRATCNPEVCPASDYDNNCPRVGVAVSRAKYSTPTDGTFNCDTQCCDVCAGAGAVVNGCWPSGASRSNDIFKAARYYPSGMPTVPGDTIAVNKITFFGCDQLDDTTRSSVVYIPLTLIRSGKGGFSTETGVFEASGFPANFLTPEIVDDIIASGEASFPANFATCLACLYAGKMNRDNNYLSAGTDPRFTQCRGCRAAFCAV